VSDDNEPSLWTIETVIVVAVIAAMFAVVVAATLSLFLADGKPVY